MIKRISKILIAAALVVGVFPLQAQATTNYSEASSNNYVYVDGSHWRQLSNGSWQLATADWQQAVTNGWAYVDGYWYYFNKNGIMLSDTFFYDVNADKRYYLSTSGAMITNGYYTDTFTGHQYKCGPDGALEVIKINSSVSIKAPKNDDIKEIDGEYMPTGPWN